MDYQQKNPLKCYILPDFMDDMSNYHIASCRSLQTWKN